MHFQIRPATLERLMDDQAVLARRTLNDDVAQMHRDLEQMYRDRLVQTMILLGLTSPSE